MKEIEKIIRELRFSPIHNEYQIAQAIQRWILSKVPASNRKSCLPEDHYFSQFKEGFNCCRRQLLLNLKD